MTGPPSRIRAPAECGTPDWIAIGDALWLAAVVGVGLDEPARPAVPRDAPVPPASRAAAPSAGDVAGNVERSGTEGGSRAAGPLRVLHPESRSAVSAAAGPAPRGLAALAGSRAIERALRPFKHRVLTTADCELDEEATAERAAEDGLWLPELRPGRGRWLSLALVADADPTMDVWQPSLAAFRELVQRHGSFRGYREFRLHSGSNGRPPLLRAGPGGSIRHPAELIDPAGRQIILVFTDGRGGVWRGDQMTRLLQLWGRSGPLAVINPYPQRYWRRGTLDPYSGLVRSPRAAAPNSRLAVREADRDHDPFAQPGLRPEFPVPVLELNARWIGWWAKLVTAPPDAWVKAVLLSADGARAVREATDEPASSSAWDLVLRFRNSAESLSFRLATQLAAAPLELALARRVQSTLLPQSRPHHLAEVITSPLVSRTDDPAGGTWLDFRAGVRDVLISALTRDETARVLQVVAVHYGGHTASGLDPLALLGPAEPDGVLTLSPETLPLARIELAALRALSGPYTLYAKRLADSIAVTVLRNSRDDGTSTASGRDESTDQGAEWEEGTAPHQSTASASGSTQEPTGAHGREHPWRHGAAPGPAADPEPEDSGSRPDGRRGDGTMTGPRDDDLAGPGWPRLRPPAPIDPYPLPGRAPRRVDDLDLTVDTLFGPREQTVGPAIWGNVPNRNSAFTGRAEMLVQLERRLRTDSVTAVLPQALHGMGGVGKSQIAIEYAYRHRDEYELVWWIPSEQPGQILASLSELGEHLGHEPGLEIGASIAQVQTALRSGVPYAKWLLVFDNAETLEAVRPYIPESGSGKVLVTSRNAAWGQVAQSLEIDVFTREESIELLLRRNHEASDADADRLALALGDLPLAVEHASAWCATTRTPLADYLALVEEKLEEMATLVAEPGYELPVAAAWGVALDRLRVDNLPALRLLQVCSFFAPEPISQELFTCPRVNPRIPELDEVLQDSDRLPPLLRDIQNFGLARIDHRTNTIQLHRLVKAVLIAWMAPDRRSQMEHGAHMLLAGGNPGRPDKRALWERYQELGPHVTASRMLSCEDNWARALVLDVIAFYYWRGDLGSSRDLAQSTFEEWHRLLGADHAQTLKAAKWLGFIHRAFGNFSAARLIDQDCLNRYQEAAKPDIEGLIDAMNMLANDLRIAGEFGSARELDVRALRLAQDAIGDDDPATLKAANSLGVSLRLTGEFLAARERDGDTHRRRVAVLGEDHPETLLSLNNLLLDHRECGYYMQAHELQEHLYMRYQTVLGAAHPMTITAARNLAVARRRAGRRDEGRKLAEEAWTRFRQRFGENSVDAIAAALNYAVSLREAGELDEAAALAQQAVEQYDEVLGPEHPYTLYARTNLAILLRLQGRAHDAYGHNTHVLAGLERQLGSEHILTLTCAINLASDIAALGRSLEAADLGETTYECCRRVLGVDHPSTLAAGLNLAMDRIAGGSEQAGEELYGRILDAFGRVLGLDHPAMTAAVSRKRADCDVDPMQF
ncbi:FxSxx-COOH system tetratricopeptide repeat protein [Actinospica robiniae]|uniref:FxSxx-COOH system tetratricopeptide repeat protein n=1 Tax=Actinospica robiniae TaxID=304901 RepID=UPI0024817753|nr:FxSxx-COOH system tetratricopeptide repeat protein [Actinospica robiniae]